MPSDSDPISTKKSSDDFVSMIADALGSVQYKLFALMFIAFLVVSSDMFIGRVLTKISGAVDMKTPTSYGTILQGTAMIFAVLLMDMLIRIGIV